MRLPRFTTRRLMVLVAVVALILGLAVNDPFLAVILIGVALLIAPQAIVIAVMIYLDERGQTRVSNARHAQLAQPALPDAIEAQSTQIPLRSSNRVSSE